MQCKNEICKERQATKVAGKRLLVTIHRALDYTGMNSETALVTHLTFDPHGKSFFHGVRFSVQTISLGKLAYRTCVENQRS